MVSAAPAHAGSIDAAGTRIFAFGDSHASPFAALVPSDLAQLQRTYCGGKGDRGPALSLAGGLKAARAVVAADSHGRGLKAFAHSPDGRSEDRAIADAVGSLGLGKPAAALAALLQAHAVAPRDPAPLIDAAALLNEAGRGRAALAFLKAAAKLRLPRTKPFGIPWSAVAQANRGQALMVTHQYPAAEKALASALKTAPLLTEADQNMAVAYVCQGNQQKARPFFVAAIRRQAFAPSDYFGLSTVDPFGELPSADILDLSQGQTLTLPNFKLPTTIDEGRAQEQAWVSMEQPLNQQGVALNQALNSDEVPLQAKLRTDSPATRQRTQDIIREIANAVAEPDLAALSAQAVALQKQLGAYSAGVYTGGCLISGDHSAWLAVAQRYQTVQRQFAVALYKRETALAANLEDPAAHQVAMDIARKDVEPNLFLLVNDGAQLTFYDYTCDTNPNVLSPEDPESGSTQEPASLPCPSGLSAPDFSLNLIVFQVSVT
jgi:tetratricopeptide (TPR) repeat protein